MTSLNSGEAKNFGRAEHMEHDARYDRADEFMDVVLGHWNTWEDDVLIPRQGEQPLCRFGKGAPAGSRGTLFSIARPIQRAALAARASRAHPGGSIRPRPVFCREVGRPARRGFRARPAMVHERIPIKPLREGAVGRDPE